MTGHIAKACRNKDKVCRSSHPRRGTNVQYCVYSKTLRANVTAIETTDEKGDEEEIYYIDGLYDGRRINKPYLVELLVNQSNKPFEMDTGARVTIISEETYHLLFSRINLEKTKVSIKTYSDEPLHVLGLIYVDVAQNNLNYLLSEDLG